MRRREFIAGLGSAVAAVWPLAARAQQPAMPVIGFLGNESFDLWADRLLAFRRGLSEAGYVDGRNVAIEYRWADDQLDRLPALAADLVRRQVTVIVTLGGVTPTRAAKAATTTIPIVFTTSSDPVQVGLVASLSRPGGNLTGVTSLNQEVAPKRLELLRELLPKATTIAALFNSSRNQETNLNELQAAARALGLQLQVLHASTDHEIDDAFAAMTRLRPDGLVFGTDSFLISRRERLADLALRHAVPAIYIYREFAVAGGLMSYGGGLAEAYRLAALSTARILKGENPADLPLRQATKVELV